MANTEVNLFSAIRGIADARDRGNITIPSIHRFQVTEQFFNAQRLAALEIADAGYSVPPILDAVLVNTPSLKFGTFKNAIRRAPRYTEPALRHEPIVLDDWGDRLAVIEDEEDF